MSDELLYKIDNKFMNLGISMEGNILIGDTNISTAFETFQIQLPVGAWEIGKRSDGVLQIKKKIIDDPMDVPPAGCMSAMLFVTAAILLAFIISFLVLHVMGW